MRAFENDTANDWAYDLADVQDLSVICETIAACASSEYVDDRLGAQTVAACDVLARLLGKSRYCDAYTEKIDIWVRDHPQPVPPKLRSQAVEALDKIRSDDSELAEEWSEDESTYEEWAADLDELAAALQ
ncbi:MAG: DUF4259 domain-containing protein [Planctomycetaceae bacterium]|nr:DUF4259 domain-containing protein [Planctomycetaceae bacterium]